MEVAFGCFHSTGCYRSRDIAGRQIAAPYGFLPLICTQGKLLEGAKRRTKIIANPALKCNRAEGEMQFVTRKRQFVTEMYHSAFFMI